MTDLLKIIHGDALTSLRELESESVQTCVTSPPYWGLRDYGLEPLIWGPPERPWEPAVCKHEWTDATYVRNNDQTAGEKQRTNVGAVGRDEPVASAFCECGAWRGSLGLEPTPELYVQHIVQTFQEVKRVLREDGTLWLNLGDSYATGTTAGRQLGTLDFGVGTMKARQIARCGTPDGLKTKDLVGIPWAVAFALRADGWYLRSDIIWAKPNPMPESVTDRPTKSHEYLFLLSKSQKYYYDAEAIKEPQSLGTHERFGKGAEITVKHKTAPNGSGIKNNPSFNEAMASMVLPGGLRNKRSVWEIPTAPFPDAHFATFPPELVIPCVLAGSKAGDVVMDPFGGSGTTGKVAIELGRKAIVIEPKEEYIRMIEKRCTTTIGLPLAITPRAEMPIAEGLVTPIEYLDSSEGQSIDLGSEASEGILTQKKG